MHPIVYVTGCKCQGESVGHISFVIEISALFFHDKQHETLLAEAFLNVFLRQKYKTVALEHHSRYLSI